jgi:phage baseplate assembly protein W
MNKTLQRQELARVDVQDALRRWEPRCRVRSVTTAVTGPDSRSLIDLTAQVEIAGKIYPLKKTI